MSYLVWNLNDEAIKSLCISTAFLRDEATKDVYFLEDLIVLYFKKDKSDFETVEDLIASLENHAPARDAVETANTYLHWVFNDAPPAGLCISTRDFYNHVLDMEDVFD